MNTLLRNFYLIAIALLFSFSFTACSKDDETAVPNIPSNPTTFAFSFTANGTNNTCLEALVTANSIANPLGGSLMALSGVSTTGQVINLSFNPTVGSKTVGGLFSVSTISLTIGTDVKLCTSGNITVTANDATAKKITGTFSGTGNGVTITNGVFTYVGY